MCNLLSFVIVLQIVREETCRESFSRKVTGFGLSPPWSMARGHRSEAQPPHLTLNRVQ